MEKNRLCKNIASEFNLENDVDPVTTRNLLDCVARLSPRDFSLDLGSFMIYFLTLHDCNDLEDEERLEMFLRVLDFKGYQRQLYSVSDENLDELLTLKYSMAEELSESKLKLLCEFVDIMRNTAADEDDCSYARQSISEVIDERCRRIRHAGS